MQGKPKKALRSLRRVPRISEAEWVIMRALWEHGAATTNDVVAAVQPGSGWKPKTIHTLLRRLARKGALRFEKKGREYLFTPRLSADDCEYAAMRSFLGGFFGGEFAPFLARFVEREKFSAAEIDELKEILERKIARGP
jgi:BlaI family penicillinase repressor